ncbi:DMT family transporter [Limobrevibacterium gyesilva]|uniref:DMT family transporter n=1 Tax=Limobrevibacterium gyesilva TaxID=2991712 RepID=A0AA42CEL4_9PROT|nr:DMT family transporter [Limobrevibacterium gyesilva]MCW3476193.1 DMT family transporter [Limobrevibacterium gyesilva]
MSLDLPREAAGPALAPGRDASATLAGIGLTVLGVFLFSGCNALAKWLVASYPVGETLFVRSLTALLLVAPFITRADLATLRPDRQFRWRPGLHLLRVFCSAIEVGCFYWALVYIPLADVSTIYLAGPIYVTAMSALFLGEQVGWRRWTAVLAGFAGVLVALRPTGNALSPQAVVAVLGSLLYAISLVATRRLRGTPNPVLVASQFAALLLLSAASAAFGWVLPTPGDAVLLALVGAVAMLAYLCVNRGLQLTPASVVAPFQYSSIIWAVALGYVVFGDIPGINIVIGAAIIVGAGLVILFREEKRRRT